MFDNEPHVAPALLALPNVIVQPHQGSATVETRTAIGQLMIDNISAHFAGRPLLTPVAMTGRTLRRVHCAALRVV